MVGKLPLLSYVRRPRKRSIGWRRHFAKEDGMKKVVKLLTVFLGFSLLSGVTAYFVLKAIQPPAAYILVGVVCVGVAWVSSEVAIRVSRK